MTPAEAQPHLDSSTHSCRPSAGDWKCAQAQAPPRRGSLTPWLYAGPRKGDPYLQRRYRYYYSCDAELLSEPGAHGDKTVRRSQSAGMYLVIDRQRAFHRTDKIIDGLMIYAINNGVLTRSVWRTEGISSGSAQSADSDPNYIARRSLFSIVALILVRASYWRLLILSRGINERTRSSRARTIYTRWPCPRSSEAVRCTTR